MRGGAGGSRAPCPGTTRGWRGWGHDAAGRPPLTAAPGRSAGSASRRAACGAGPGLRRRPLLAPWVPAGRRYCAQSVPQAGPGRGFLFFRHPSGFLHAELSVLPGRVFPVPKLRPPQCRCHGRGRRGDALLCCSRLPCCCGPPPRWPAGCLLGIPSGWRRLSSAVRWANPKAVFLLKSCGVKQRINSSALPAVIL